jgi:S-adenosylmethionine-diacylglycerol 3-amino-3-carboxypropyl transferase
MKLADHLSQRVFRAVHQNSLVYNTCWEDPRLDREALQIAAGDRIAMITSAGCNALDYALLEPESIHAVDMNPRQNALCELKMAAIRELDYQTFFEMFGQGGLPNYQEVWQQKLRKHVSIYAQNYWDRNIAYFQNYGWRFSFYFHGASGFFARLMNTWINQIPGLREALTYAFESDCLNQQKSIYEDFKNYVWKDFLKWILRRDATLSLLGVPRAQRREVEHNQPGGIAGFIENCVESVFTMIPLKDNYFWRVYLTGSYTSSCCPEYLKKANFDRLKSGLVDRIKLYTGTLENFFTEWTQSGGSRFNKFTLLDHMDWLASVNAQALSDEWTSLLKAAAPNSRVIWRGGGTNTAFVDALTVRNRGREHKLAEFLRREDDLASKLHQRDRVHTYGSFHIAQLALN